MKTVLAIIALIALTNAVYTGFKPESVPVEGRYIFQFHYNATTSMKNAFFNSFTAIEGHSIRKQFQILDFHAFSAETTRMYVESNRQSDLFLAVEQDMTVHIEQRQCVTQKDATWGINRISDKALELKGDYFYQWTGQGTDSYIIDTGILTTHNEFTGRAVHGATFTGDGRDDDCNGHGTHVAGTVGGFLYGVAKNVSLIAVKVLNCQGSGTYEGVLAGVNYVAQQYTDKKKPSTANMSLGGGRHVPLNNAVEACVRAGVVVVVAGGNSNADACNYSPASALLAITVGSTDANDIQDIRSSFSNFGRCTDIWAPGSMITSAWIGSNTAVRTISGTSMASPHTCGVANQILQANPTWTPAQVEAYMIEQSSKGIINLSCGNRAACLESPNRLAHSTCAAVPTI